MRARLLYILLLAAPALWAQDKVYFLDGSSKSGHVTEIGPDYIMLDVPDATETLPREKLLLIEFKDGSVEVLNKPAESAVYNAGSTSEPRIAKEAREQASYNLFSVNTLALCNSDVSVFFERILPGRHFGLGLMGAYNFNHYASVVNLWINPLDNAKKNYDLGAFANIYPAGIGNNTTVYCGILFKYMRFSFTSVIEDPVTSGGSTTINIKYRPSTGSQLATIFTMGTHTRLAKNYFIKTLFGLGGFNLHGDYKSQYNYQMTQASRNGSGTITKKYDTSFLLKFYFGIMVGFDF